MLRSILVLATVALAAFSAPIASAEEKAQGKDVKVTGTLVCAKCKLKLDGVKECTNALQVKEDDKTVTYLLTDKGSEEDYHVCGGGEKKDVTVSGKLTEKDGKKTITPTKIELKK
ncbi:DUF6370 family protein [Limnoglobus roseus]|uniref:Uncharacterized protein n=1 Tax=Limnoglobus roseus TaxID=2598579 RepID=A0A5C1A7H7_9BACT|nr:DUF6370 family protein [Limnoglobus roseus]QEL14167.1 hypothetical protein PX52LOC_01037 [Limnoglobus roseus]